MGQSEPESDDRKDEGGPAKYKKSEIGGVSAEQAHEVLGFLIVRLSDERQITGVIRNESSKQERRKADIEYPKDIPKDTNGSPFLHLGFGGFLPCHVGRECSAG